MLQSEIHFAINGVEAVEKVSKLWNEENKAYSLIIMDLNMPLLDG